MDDYTFLYLPRLRSRHDYQGQREARQCRREEINHKMKKVKEELSACESDRERIQHALGMCHVSVRENL